MKKAKYKIEKKAAVCREYAYCEDCDWELRDVPNVQACAANHAIHYGHTAHAEIGILTQYVPIK